MHRLRWDRRRPASLSLGEYVLHTLPETLHFEFRLEPGSAICSSNYRLVVHETGRFLGDLLAFDNREHHHFDRNCYRTDMPDLFARMTAWLDLPEFAERPERE